MQLCHCIVVLCCRYILWSPMEAGLGNHMLSLVSTFLYALLTSRVLLIEPSPASISHLFCDPFAPLWTALDQGQRDSTGGSKGAGQGRGGDAPGGASQGGPRGRPGGSWVFPHVEEFGGREVAISGPNMANYTFRENSPFRTSRPAPPLSVLLPPLPLLSHRTVNCSSVSCQGTRYKAAVLVCVQAALS